MSLTEPQKAMLRNEANGYAVRKHITVNEVVIPQESQDWGFSFNPAYNEVVVEVEIHSNDAVNVLFINSDFEIVDFIEFEPEF